MARGVFIFFFFERGNGVVDQARAVGPDRRRMRRASRVGWQPMHVGDIAAQGDVAEALKPLAFTDVEGDEIGRQEVTRGSKFRCNAQDLKIPN